MTTEALESFITLRAVMLHAVKYLLIAMQFPQVHKKLYDDDVEFCVRPRRPELNYQIEKKGLQTIDQHQKAKCNSLSFPPAINFKNL